MSEKSKHPDYLKNGLILSGTAESEFLPLRNGEIHVWTASLARAGVQMEWMQSVLSNEERKRASYFKFESKQQSFILTQAVLRILISVYLNTEPSEIVFDIRKKGKPFILNDPSLFFNVSNSHEICVYAFSRDGELGIDIEFIRELHDLDQLIEKNLTSREKAFLRKDPDRRLSRFFQFWTCKESYVKAIGEGMRLTPENIEFSLEDETIRLRSLKYGFDTTDWRFKGFTREGNYTGTLAFAGQDRVIRELDVAFKA